MINIYHQHYPIKQSKKNRKTCHMHLKIFGDSILIGLQIIEISRYNLHFSYMPVNCQTLENYYHMS